MTRLHRFTLALAMVAAVALAWVSNVQQAEAHPDYGCHSCHVPHGAHDEVGVPLWNPDHTTTTLTGSYNSDDSSPTMDATTGEVNGASKLCLSCHDGTYPAVARDDAHTAFGDGNNLGGLAQSHPISFVYDTALATADGELVDPTTLPSDILDTESRMQCTSCHDVHATTATETGNL